MRVLGIDPGLRITGYAVVEGDPLRPAIVEAGVFRLGKNGPARSLESIPARLVELERDMGELLDRTRPDIAAVEGLFAHYKHPATAIVMGHGRGVILLAIQRAGVDLVELKPKEAKKSITGSGSASKAQVGLAVADLFALETPPAPEDLSDALSIAVTALRRAEIESRMV